MDSKNAQAQGQTPVQGMGGEAVAEGGDWRTQLEAGSRYRIVNKIMNTLIMHLPFAGQEGLEELEKIAVKFEEKIYAGATSQSDYLRKISLKMVTMETKAQNPPLQSNGASNGTNSPNPDSLF